MKKTPAVHAGLLVALLALATGCGGDEGSSDAAEPTMSAQPTTLTITGSIEAPIDFAAMVKEKHHYVGETPCSADDGYDDVQAGAQVTIRDGGGATVALGELGPGLLGGKAGDSLYAAPCAFAFEVGDVPVGGKFYSIEVAHRGEVSFDEDELEDPVTLTLGD